MARTSPIHALTSLGRSLRFREVVVLGTVLSVTAGVLYFDRAPASKASVPEPTPTLEAHPRITYLPHRPGRVTTGRCWGLEGFPHAIHALAFSPDGSLLA